MSNEITLPLADYVGMRFDRALALAHTDLSRMQWQTLIKEGKVLVNGKPIKASGKVGEETSAIAVLPEIVESELVAEDIPLDVRYEDSDIIVVNKVAGMVVHPGTGHSSGTLVNALLHHCDDLAGIGDTARPGIVHRLDKDTSGLMVVAKNDKALWELQRQFAEREVHKVYMALCEGQVTPERAMIDARIGRDPKARKKMAVIASAGSATARESQTSYEVTVTYDDHSLVKCLPKTGRTHQIRVHMAYIGYPLVGDKVYGRRKQPLLPTRHFLHSAELGFKHPTSGEEMVISAELPPELQSVLDELAKS